MRRYIIILMAVAAMVMTGCTKDKSLKYNGDNPLQIALRDNKVLDIESVYGVKLTSSNESFVTVNEKSIYGKNVGDANITISNGYNTIELPVNVNLFREPSFDFGCYPSKIKAKFGEPYVAYGDSIYIYGAHEPGVSYACWQMNFYFTLYGKYYESDVYIRKDKNVDYLLEKYLDDNFTMDSIYHVNDSTNYYMYHKNSDAQIKCGKIYDANIHNDICLFYFKGNQKGVLPRRFNHESDE